MKKKINKQTVEDILRWVEWKGIDIQYDLFNEDKFRDDPKFNSILVRMKANDFY